LSVCHICDEHPVDCSCHKKALRRLVEAVSRLADYDCPVGAYGVCMINECRDGCVFRATSPSTAARGFEYCDGEEREG